MPTTLASALASSPVAVSHVRQADAFTAARESARQAREQLPAHAPPGWLLTFAGGQHDPAALLAGFRAELGDVPVVGGCGTGVITAAAASATGYECGVLLFPASLTPSAILSATGLDQDEAAVGRRLGAELRALDLPAEVHRPAVLRLDPQRPTAGSACRQPSARWPL